MKEILNYSIQPLIKSYNYLAGAMSYIETSGIQFENFIINNFCYISWRIFWNELDFKMHKFRLWDCLSAQKIRKYKVNSDVTKTICDELEKHNYVYIMLNEFYIPNREAYLVKKMRHDLTIVGFDNSKNEYDVIAFNAQAQLVHEKIPYNNIIFAYKTLGRSFIITLTIKQEYDGESLNWKKINKLLIKYNRFSKILVYGFLIRKIMYEFRNKSKISLQSISIFEEHKKILAIIAQKININSFFSITNLVEQVKLLILKYNMTKNENIINRVIEKVDQIQVMEKEIVKQMIKKIRISRSVN